jgi:hypothetical protein
VVPHLELRDIANELPAIDQDSLAATFAAHRLGESLICSKHCCQIDDLGTASAHARILLTISMASPLCALVLQYKLRMLIIALQKPAAVLDELTVLGT